MLIADCPFNMSLMLINLSVNRLNVEPKHYWYKLIENLISYIISLVLHKSVVCYKAEPLNKQNKLTAQELEE